MPDISYIDDIIIHKINEELFAIKINIRIVKNNKIKYLVSTLSADKRIVGLYRNLKEMVMIDKEITSGLVVYLSDLLNHR